MTPTTPHTPGWQFASAEEALFWSADVLRLRHLPKLTSLWREVLAEAPCPDAPSELDRHSYAPSERDHLPRHEDDRLSLALAVERLLEGMEESGQLLRLHAWGDWVNDVRLRAALALQERLRRQGHTLRLNYRMSLRQLGTYLGRDKKTVSKHLSRAMALLAQRLDREGLLFSPHMEAGTDAAARTVNVHQFRH